MFLYYEMYLPNIANTQYNTNSIHSPSLKKENTNHSKFFVNVQSLRKNINIFTIAKLQI